MSAPHRSHSTPMTTPSKQSSQQQRNQQQRNPNSNVQSATRSTTVPASSSAIPLFSPIAPLPDTLLTLIFSHLPASQSYCLSRVSREWRSVIQEPWLWKVWFIQRYPETKCVREPKAERRRRRREEEKEEGEIGGLDDDEDEEEDDDDLKGLDDDDDDTEFADTDSDCDSSTHFTLDTDDVGVVSWQSQYHSRHNIHLWSSALFTPPRLRSGQHSKRSSGDKPLVEQQARRGDDTPNKARHEKNNSSSSSSSSSSFAATFASPPSNRTGLQRSRSTSWSDEKRLGSRRYSEEGAAEVAASSSSTTVAVSSSSSSSVLSSAASASLSSSIPSEPLGNNHTPLPIPRQHTGTHANAHLRPMKHAFGANNGPVSQGPAKRGSKSGSSGSGGGGSLSSSLPSSSPYFEQQQSQRKTKSPGFGPMDRKSKSPGFGPTNSERFEPNMMYAQSMAMEGGDYDYYSQSQFDLDSSSSSSSSAPIFDSSAPLILTGHRSAVTCLQFDDSRLAYGSGRDVRIHSLRTGRSLDVVRIMTSNSTTNRNGLVTSLDFSPASHILVASGTDNAIRIVDMDSMNIVRVTAKKSAHTDLITCLKLSSNERSMTSAGLDASFKLWSVEDGACVTTWNQGDTGKVGMIVCMEKIRQDYGSKGASASNHKSSSHDQDTPLYLCGTSYQNLARVVLYDIRTSKAVHNMAVSDSVTSVGDSSSSASSSSSSTPYRPTSMICSLSYSSTNYAFVAGGNDGSVQVYDIRKMSDDDKGMPVMVDVPPLDPVMGVIAEKKTSRPDSPSSAAAVVPERPTVTFADSITPPSSALTSSSSISSLSSSSSSSTTSAIPIPPLVATSSTGSATSSIPPADSRPRFRPSPPIQSVHLDSTRLLVCQKRVVSIYSASSLLVSTHTGLDFTHLIHRITLDDIQRWISPRSKQQQSNNQPPQGSSNLNPQFFHYMKYDQQSGTMALATTDAVLVWQQKRNVFELK